MDSFLTPYRGEAGLTQHALCERSGLKLATIRRSEAAFIENTANSWQLVRQPIRSLRSHFLGGLLLATLTSVCFPVLAADFVVDTMTNVQNGAPTHIVNGSDTLTITSSGAIEVVGADTVDLSGGNNSIVNRGLLSVDGLFLEAINLGSNNEVHNSGTIIVSGNGSNGITPDMNNVVINSGKSLTSGGFSDAIFAASGNSITNTGLLSATGNNSNGISTGGDNTVINHGTILTSGNFFGSEGILAGGANNLITNTGTIFTSGTFAVGIIVSGSSVVNNSGKIVSVQSNSFTLRNSSNTLNLSDPSFIGGLIDLGTDATVNITTGPSHAILWDFSTGTMIGQDPNVGGTVPWFYNPVNKKIATFDSTLLAAAQGMLTDKTAVLSNTIQRRIERASVTHKARDEGSWSPTIWTTGFISESTYVGGAPTLDHTITISGGAAGMDITVKDGWTIGALGGFMEGNAEAQGRYAPSFDLTRSEWFLGGYSRLSKNRFFIDAGLTAGFNISGETDRFVNDNLAPLGVSYARATTDGGSFWISPEIAAGVDLGDWAGWTLAPNIKLRYAAEWFDGYAETGPSAEANAMVDQHMIAFGEAKLELLASRPMAFGHNSALKARIAALGRMSLGDDEVTLTLNDITQGVPHYSEDSFFVSAGLDLDIGLTENFSMHISGLTSFGSSQSNAQAMVGVQFSF